MPDPKTNGDGSDRPHAPLRRERAPTITIDTSAVSSTPDSAHPPTQVFPHQRQPSLSVFTDNAEATDTSTLLNSSKSSPSDLHAPSVLSFGSDQESRPTSPHNVSSPTSKQFDSNSHFLSVPGSRSRGNSLESEDSTNSGGSYSGDTYVPATSHTSNPSSETGKDPASTLDNEEDALKPDPGREADFDVEDNKFAFSPGQLNKLLNPKSLGAFHALGGLRGLEKGLRTDVNAGLSFDEGPLDGTVAFDDAVSGKPSPGLPKAVANSQLQATRTRPSSAGSSANQREDAFADRKRIYGINKLPEKKAKSIWELAWIAYNDKVLILLTVAAVISLALGIYQSVHPEDNEARVQWVEGAAIIVAILIVVVVGAANDWQKERQFVKLNKKKDDRQVKVVRSGKTVEIPIFDVLVGDVMHMEPGDLVPVDGIFIGGHNVKCDESSATGESDVLRKTPGGDVYRAIERHENLSKRDPFIISGAKISEGIGTFLVTATGVHSSYGKTMMSLQDEGQTTPLQTKLNVLAEYVAKLGLASGLLLFVVLFIKFLASLKDIDGASNKGRAFLQIFIVAVTIIVVAVPEGLPLAVTLALAFATTRMLRDNNLVRLLRACETMGNATTICSDKTGTLTENKMTAVAGTFGMDTRFGEKPSPTDQSDGPPEDTGSKKKNATSPSDFGSKLSRSVKELLLQSIVLNSTAFEGEHEGMTMFIGSKTETALLSFAREFLGLGSLSEARSNANIVQMVPFDSSRKCMAVVVKLDNGRYRMLVKGASEILINRSTRIINDATKELGDSPLADRDRATLTAYIDDYAARSLRTIGLVYRDFDQWPPRGAPTEEDRSIALFDPVFKDMVTLGVVGIQDPLRAGVTEAVERCQRAGVFVRMVTGDNINTAKAIAQECGVFTPGGIAIEGPKFRKLSTQQMNQIIPRLQVVARSSPDDKKILVNQLKKLGETVAVTGDGTNDAQALKTADVGFSMGITGTEVAKEASDIILMDDNFSSIVKAMAWGRTVNDAVKKFLQFQITVNITAVIVTFVSAVASGNENSVLTAVQLLWVNLIMDTFAALALATDTPTESVLERRPQPKSESLITLTMWKMIIGQTIYQLIVTLVLNFAGEKIFHYNNPKVMKTVVFNTFVWMQIFNQYNSRRVDNNFNIFEGILKNRWFAGIQLIIVGGQILIIFVGGQAFSVTRLNGAQWAVALVLGVISIPVGVVIRLIPDEFIKKLIPTFWFRKKSPEVVVSDEDRRFQWNPALEEIRDQLSFLKTVRGGRLRHLKHKLQHPQEFLPKSRSGSRSREQSAPPSPGGDGSASPHPPSTPDSRSRRRTRSRSSSAFGPATAMAGVVAGSIAGWSPIERPHEDDPDTAKFPSNSPHGGLDKQQGIEIHPDTAADDKIIPDQSPSTFKVPPSQNPDITPYFEHAPERGRAQSSHSKRPSSRRSRSSHGNSQA